MDRLLDPAFACHSVKVALLNHEGPRTHQHSTYRAPVFPAAHPPPHPGPGARGGESRLSDSFVLLRHEPAGLACPQIGVYSAPAQQIMMSAFFNDASMIEHNQAVHGGDGRQPMSNGDYGLAGHQAQELFLDRGLSLGVEGACGLVEDQNRRVLQQHRSYSDPLALPARQLDPPLSDACLVALAPIRILEIDDELIRVRTFRSLDRPRYPASGRP